MQCVSCTVVNVLKTKTKIVPRICVCSPRSTLTTYHMTPSNHYITLNVTPPSLQSVQQSEACLSRDPCLLTCGAVCRLIRKGRPARAMGLWGETLLLLDLLQFPGWSDRVSSARPVPRDSGKRGGAVGEVVTSSPPSRDSCLLSKGSDVITAHDNKAWQMADVWTGRGWRTHTHLWSHM